MAQDGNGAFATGFPAPFRVLDSKGFPMFQIREENGSPIMEMIGKQGQAVRLTTSDEGAAVTIIRSSSQFVRIEISGNGSSFILRSADRIIAIDATPDTQNLVMEDGARKLIDLGLTAAKSSALSIYNSVGVIGAQIGSDNATGGGAVVVADAKGDVTGFIMSEGDIDASMGIQIGGQPVATLSTNRQRDGGRVTVFDTGGEPKFVGGMTTEGDGAACASTRRGAHCLNNGFRMFP